MEPDRTAADRLCARIDASSSPYHAVATAIDALEVAGFDRLDPASSWEDSIVPGGAYYVARGGSLTAWRQPAGPIEAVRVVGAHTDSPNLRIKPHPDRTAAGVRQVNVEVYGGVLLNSWLDRDLGVSGRLTTVDGSRASGPGPSTVLVRIDEPLLRVPQLAIHLDREVNSEGLKLNPQDHLQPIWDLAAADGDGDPDRDGDGFLGLVAARAGVAEDSILAWDLMVHDLTPSRRIGNDGVFVAAPRLDNLCSSFVALDALIGSPADGGVVPVVCLYDHEEVGSTSATGADSTMLASTLERLVGGDRERFAATMARSVCLSADMAHATHPNYADRHDPQHRVSMNAGPVVKVNANQRYASDAESIATFVAACDGAGIPTQRFVSRNDMPCGSTIGPTTAARLGMSTVDVGIAQLSMHSARELCGADDVSWYEASMAAFLAG